jgi:pimeloyl-ACP methyl ester carboxylesterase
VSAKTLARAAGVPELHYVSEGGGAPVVLIHGVGADLHSWDPIAARLASRFRVIRMDLRGHGRSGRIAGVSKLADFVADVLDVMDDCRVATADVVGFSLGGMIAQAIALDHGTRADRLALISAIAGRTPEERQKVQGRLELLRTRGIEAIIGAAEDRWFTDEFRQRNSDKVRQRMAQLRANDPESYMSAYRVFSTTDLGERITDIRHKTLVVTGEHDVGSSTRMARFMRDSIPGSVLHILPQLRHSVLVEAPDVISDLLFQFLAR